MDILNMIWIDWYGCLQFIRIYYLCTYIYIFIWNIFAVCIVYAGILLAVVLSMNLPHGFLHSPGHDTPWDGVHHPLDPPGSFGQSCVLLVGLVQVPVSVGSMIPCNVDGYTILYYTILYYTILYYTILYYTILYYTILYYTILYYTILYYTILYYTILYYTILYYTILYYTILYYTILYYTILYYTILYYTILYYTILYYTILYCIHTFIHACIHTCMHTYIHTYTYTYTHRHTDIHTYNHTYIYIYTYCIYKLYILCFIMIAYVNTCIIYKNIWYTYIYIHTTVHMYVHMPIFQGWCKYSASNRSDSLDQCSGIPLFGWWFIILLLVRKLDHFCWVHDDLLYPLVNIQKTMERSTIFSG